MEDNDRVLKTLLDEDKKQGNFFSLRYILGKAHPDLSQEELIKILEKLEAKRLISLSSRKMQGSTPFVRVNPPAYAYYDNREARKAAEEAEKADADATAMAEIEEWEERTWNYKMLGVGFIAGLLSGIAIMWGMAKFFP